MIKKEWNTVDVLRQVRHDWLNKIQLIKGNIDLNKIDRTKEIINEIVIEAQNETKLSNLNLPLFTEFILTHKWENGSFQLEFEVMDDGKCNNLDDEALTSCVRLFFQCLNESIKKYADNHLFLTIESQEQGIRFFFDFCGIIERRESIEKYVNQLSLKMKLNNFTINDKDFILDVFVPS